MCLPGDEETEDNAGGYEDDRFADEENPDDSFEEEDEVDYEDSDDATEECKSSDLPEHKEMFDGRYLGDEDDDEELASAVAPSKSTIKPARLAVKPGKQGRPAGRMSGETNPRF
jgi:hypothetical protein